MVLLHKYNIFLFYIYLLIGYFFDVTDHVVCNIIICILNPGFGLLEMPWHVKEWVLFTWFGKLHKYNDFYFIFWAYLIDNFLEK